jgi:hypothetical protein
MLLSQEVAEGPKGGGAGAHLQLGRPLSITTVAGAQEFEDLDEIVARYAEPLAANFKAVTRHRCARCEPAIPSAADCHAAGADSWRAHWCPQRISERLQTCADA